jgi:hypothetical protein
MELPGRSPKMVYSLGAPPRTRVWIAGAAGVILGFGALAAVVRFQDRLFPIGNSPRENIMGESAAPFSVMTVSERRANGT